MYPIWVKLKNLWYEHASGSKDQVFYSNFYSKTCLSNFSTIAAHYDKTVNEKHNHKTKVDPKIKMFFNIYSP